MRRGLVLALAVLSGSGCDLKLRSRRASPPPPPPVAAAPTQEQKALDDWNKSAAVAWDLAKARQYGAALRALDDLSRRFPALDMATGEQRQGILEKAREDFEAVDRDAARLLAMHDEDGAIAAWTATLAFEMDDFTTRARTRIQEASKAKSERLHEAAKKEVGPILLELQGFLLERRIEEGHAMLDRALAANPALRHEIDWLRGTLIETRSVFSGVGRGMRKLKGEKVEIDGATVTVADGSFEVATFEREGGDTFTVDLAKLPPDLFVRAGREGGTTADFTGQFLLFTGRIAEARDAFRTVQNRPDLASLADLVERCLGGAPK